MTRNDLIDKDNKGHMSGKSDKDYKRDKNDESDASGYLYRVFARRFFVIGFKKVVFQILFAHITRFFIIHV